MRTSLAAALFVALGTPLLPSLAAAQSGAKIPNPNSPVVTIQRKIDFAAQYKLAPLRPPVPPTPPPRPPPIAPKPDLVAQDVRCDLRGDTVAISVRVQNDSQVDVTTPFDVQALVLSNTSYPNSLTLVTTFPMVLPAGRSMWLYVGSVDAFQTAWVDAIVDLLDQVAESDERDNRIVQSGCSLG